jgi:preprotein translocase subunit SecG
MLLSTVFNLQIPLLADFNLSHFLLWFLLTVTSFWLIFLVLIQRGKGGGLTGALGGSGGSSAFGAKAGDAFTKITVGSAAVWIFLCMLTIASINPPPVPENANAGGMNTMSGEADDADTQSDETTATDATSADATATDTDSDAAPAGDAATDESDSNENSFEPAASGDDGETAEADTEETPAAQDAEASAATAPAAE